MRLSLGWVGSLRSSTGSASATSWPVFFLNASRVDLYLLVAAMRGSAPAIDRIDEEDALHNKLERVDKVVDVEESGDRVHSRERCSFVH